MNKYFVFLFTFMLTFFSLSFSSNADSTSDDIELYYYDIGYKDVANAIIDGQKHFKKQISLPSKLPEVTFTHAFGRMNDLEGDESDELEFTFLHEDKAQNHFKILIKPVKYQLPFEEKHIKQKIKLNNGDEAIYSKRFTGFDTIAFEKNGFQYLLSMDEDCGKKMSVEALLDIANSIK